MEKQFLEQCLADGLSLNEIGRIAGKSPGTVGYWVKRHGLVAKGFSKFAPRGGIDRESLVRLLARRLTVAEIAAELDRSVSTVRYWLERHRLKPTNGGRRGRAIDWPREIHFECRHHGMTEFVLEARGYYKCKRCRSAAVSNRRRAVKQILVDEAGGCCALCGYDRCASALQFHHRDPETKTFHLASGGQSRSIARSRAEVAKCVLLCANCHAEVEAGVADLT